jgi:hypothetical protein
MSRFELNALESGGILYFVPRLIGLSPSLLDHVLGAGEYRLFAKPRVHPFNALPLSPTLTRSSRLPLLSLPSAWS